MSSKEAIKKIIEFFFPTSKMSLYEAHACLSSGTDFPVIYR